MLILLFFVQKVAVMIRGPCPSHPISASELSWTTSEPHPGCEEHLLVYALKTAEAPL